MPYRLVILIYVVLISSNLIAAAPDRPNIVLILADDLGKEDPDGHRWKSPDTPNLNRLAKNGARFNFAYAAQPICSASRAAIMTGKHPARLHLTSYLPGRADAPSQKLLQPVMEGQLPLEEVTLPELLKQRGYATGLFGKWHLGGKGFGPKEQGFDVAFEPPANSEPSETEGGKNEYAITREAIKFIEKNKDQPFFCYVPHHCPHIRLNAKPELIAKHKDKFNPTYSAMIETLDDTVGLLMKKLDELELTRNTIVIFTSDNGMLHVLESPDSPAAGYEPFQRAGKGFLYDGGLSVPLYVHWPAVIPSGLESNESTVMLTDLMPTLLDAAGIDRSKTTGPLDGISLMNLWSGEKITPTLYWHFPHYTNQGSRPASAIRENGWKLIEHLEDGSVELYHLNEYVAEVVDVAKSEPERVKDLREKLDRWRLSVGAQMPTPNPDFDAAAHRRLYIFQDPSRVVRKPTAAETALAWTDWRKAMNDAIRDRKPRITPATGDIRLFAKDARVHGEKLRYEPEPHKNVLGYWTNEKDWADWEFDVPVAGIYEAEVQQGCGANSGGAKVHVEVGGKTLEFIVQDTGHFQHMIQRTIGVVELPAGKATLAIKPQTKPGVAVMDIRRVVLRPVTQQ